MSSATKAKVLRRRAKRNEFVHDCAIAAACDRWLRSRGMTAQRETSTDCSQQRTKNLTHDPHQRVGTGNTSEGGSTTTNGLVRSRQARFKSWNDRILAHWH